MTDTSLTTQTQDRISAPMLSFGLMALGLHISSHPQLPAPINVGLPLQGEPAALQVHVASEDADQWLTTLEEIDRSERRITPAPNGSPKPVYNLNTTVRCRIPDSCARVDVFWLSTTRQTLQAVTS